MNSLIIYFTAMPWSLFFLPLFPSMNNDDSQPSAIIRWLRLDQYEAEKSVTSHFVSSKALFLIRVPLALYSTVVLWVDIGWSIATNEFRHFFAYFTHFTFIGLHAYLLVRPAFLPKLGTKVSVCLVLPLPPFLLLILPLHPLTLPCTAAY